jgi:hypothetical protein
LWHQPKDGQNENQPKILNYGMQRNHPDSVRPVYSPRGKLYTRLVSPHIDWQHDSFHTRSGHVDLLMGKIHALHQGYL